MNDEYRAKMRLLGIQLALDFTRSHASLHKVCGIDPEEKRKSLLKALEKQKEIVRELNTGEYP